MSHRGFWNRRRRRAGGRLASWFTPRRRFGLGVSVPIAVSIFSQFEFVQKSTCVLAKLPWGVGECEVIADLIAPAWALAVIPVANRLRTAAARFGTPAPDSDSYLATRLATRRFASGSARAAQWGAVLTIVLSYTREWARFGEQPDIVWFVLVIAGTFALLAVPVFWIRDELHQRGVRYLSSGRLPAWANRALMDDSDGRPPRAPHVLAFASVTALVVQVVLSQFDALLRGMHPPGDPSVGIGGLAAISEFDLSQKPGIVIERVTSWQDYTEAVGAQFGSAYDVVTAHAVLDTIATIPAYLVLGAALAAYAWRHRLQHEEDSSMRRAFELVTLTGLVVLIATATLDVGKNLFTWYVMDAAWNRPADLTNANVRLLWFFAIARTVGLGALAAASLLLVALWDAPTRRLRQALLAVRSEILLLALFGIVVLASPQTADVIRGWRVSHTVITVGLATVLSMLVRWTAVTNLRLQHRHWERAEQGLDLLPARLRIPFTAGAPTVGRFAAALVIALAGLQLLVGLGLNVGRGLVVPAIFVLVLWLFGLALPPAPYVRGDRPVSVQMRRRLTRILGAAVYLIIGIAVVKAAASSVAYANNEDWWLFFALVPPAIGLWRIATRTTATMGALEAGFAGTVLITALVMLVAGDRELSPTALAFAGITFSYGSMAFFNSYERTSLVNRLSRQYLSPAWAQPFVITAGFAMAAVVLAFYLDPISLAPQIGTIGMIVIAMMVFTLLGAGAVRFAELTRPPRILAAFGIKRTPVVFLLALWLLLAPAVIDQRFNDIRVKRNGDQAMTNLDFDDVWRRWAANNLSNTTPDVGGSPGPISVDRPVVPLLLVSSSGGGLRAAAWTSFVLDCVFEGTTEGNEPCGRERPGTPPVHRVALMSGVSGGSLGMAEYLAHLLDGFEGSEGSNTWVDDALGDDYLAAAIGWLFFVDIPRSLIGFGTGISNRAEVMERAWEASWPDNVSGLRRGINELWATSTPPVIFNGTSVNDGCRVNVSALNANGGSPEVPSCAGADDSTAPTTGVLGATHDLADFLCPGDDVALSTAAGMSARFPVVSVAGRIAADPDRSCEGTRSGAVFVVDGGYLEGSGAGTLLNAWEALAGWVEQYNTGGAESCVVPFMLHIDNGYESPSVTGNEAVPREFLVPLLTAFNSSSGITAARAEAALAFEHPFTVAGSEVAIALQTEDGPAPVTSRYARLVTRAHPGVQAPLGWTLSGESLDDLRDQLGIAENVKALAEIRSWLDGEMLCRGG